ncbi:hypothetical protein H702_01750 [Streptococcus equinus JB1]|uniref:Uncharacterized protein n=1 Tax=Streptococcus equinus JB1 TaxID=1294274 RepID=A0A091BSI0_STREI|nr:hypothetical protein [Streptococcus equinus]KFN88616.1 hypothetical protein H702_01750 [Streptococcus equinus JB1]SFL28107.1 hypothetical protein SAMN02910290_01174 [Streptococcus equinus JB1]
MRLIKRLRILLKYQEGNIKRGASQLGNCSLLFILYPLVFLIFYGTMQDSELPTLLSEIIFYIGILVWMAALLLAILSYFKKNQVLVGISTYLMSVYGCFTLPVSSTTAWGNGHLNFIILQEVSIILWPLISYLIFAYCMVNRNGEIIHSEKWKKLLLYVVMGPGLFLSFISLLLIYFVSDYYCIYLVWGLELALSPALISGWFTILYPLRHKDDEGADLTEASKAQSQAVNALNETLQNKHFGKDEIKED